MAMIPPGSFDHVEKIFSVAEKIIVLSTAFVAAIKFKVFQLWKQSYRTEMQCGHEITSAKDVVFWADYSIINTGDRPLHVERVQLELRQAEEKDHNLVPGRQTLNGLLPTVIAREQEADQYTGKTHFKPIGTHGFIGKGERAIFTLRCRIAELPDVVFVVGKFWERSGLFKTGQSEGSSYISMYLRSSDSSAAQGG